MALLLTIMKQQWHTDKCATPFLFKYTQKIKALYLLYTYYTNTHTSIKGLTQIEIEQVNSCVLTTSSIFKQFEIKYCLYTVVKTSFANI